VLLIQAAGPGYFLLNDRIISRGLELNAIKIGNLGVGFAFCNECIEFCCMEEVKVSKSQTFVFPKDEHDSPK
jgi:hypothetical protein